MSDQKKKIAIPSSNEDGLKSMVLPRFGRCPFFTIVTIENNEIQEVTIIENGGINAMGGAGPLAAQTIAQEGVSVVIGGNYGPNAANALTQGNIESYGFPSNQQNVTVNDIIQLYLNNKLPKISGANVGSHFGMGGGGGGGGMGGGRGMGGGQGRGRNL